MTCNLVAFPLSHPHKPFVSNFTIKCALTKQGLKFLSTLSLKSGDNAVAGKLIGKFVAGSPKSISLNALFHLLSPDTTHPNLAHHSLHLYLKIKEATWFEYNPKLAASLAALLEKQGKHGESEALISEAVSKLQDRHRDLTAFRFNLLESHAKHGASPGLDRSIAKVRDLAVGSSSTHLKRRSFESLIGGLCAADRPAEAEASMEEMRSEGLNPSVFEFRSIVYSYGRTGLLEDMDRVVGLMERDGMAIDTVCSNMVLSSYGAHEDLSGMLTWLRRMKSSEVAFSVRTYNSVLNRCPGVLEMLRDFDGAPVSIDELGSRLEGDEAGVVGELVGPAAGAVLEGAMEWGASEAKLDLHGMHLGTAYLILMEWMVEMRRRLGGDGSGGVVVPAEVVVVCGSGKHSNLRGVSPVKLMVREMMRRTGSPMRIDRKNSGCFIAKGKNVRDWLCK